VIRDLCIGLIVALFLVYFLILLSLLCVGSISYTGRSWYNW